MSVAAPPNVDERLLVTLEQRAHLGHHVRNILGHVHHRRASIACATATSVASLPRAPRIDSPTGSPSTVADKLIEAAKGLRIGNLIALLQIGSMPHELTKQNITLFAEGVMPKLRRLWTEEGYQHRWWPQGAENLTPAAGTPVGD